MAEEEQNHHCLISQSGERLAFLFLGVSKNFVVPVGEQEIYLLETGTT